MAWENLRAEIEDEFGEYTLDFEDALVNKISNLNEFKHQFALSESEKEDFKASKLASNWEKRLRKLGSADRSEYYRAWWRGYNRTPKRKAWSRVYDSTSPKRKARQALKKRRKARDLAMANAKVVAPALATYKEAMDNLRKKYCRSALVMAKSRPV